MWRMLITVAVIIPSVQLCGDLCAEADDRVGESPDESGQRATPLSHQAEADHVHTWTDAHGRKIADAMLVRSGYDTALKKLVLILKKKDGEVLRIPMDQIGEQSKKQAMRIARQRQRMRKRNPRVDKIIDELKRMPAMTELSVLNRSGKKNVEDIAKIEHAVRRIAQFESSEIRAAEEEYLSAARKPNHRDYLHVEGKLYVLNKFLFRLPDTPTKGSPGFGAGWFRAPLYHSTMRWPWEEDENENWRLTDVCSVYFGAPYFALSAFDYYEKHFGRRLCGKPELALGSPPEPAHVIDQ